MSKALFANLIKYYQKIFNKELFIITLMLLGIGLPVAPFLVGFSQFLLMFIWLADGTLKRKWELFKADKALQIFLIVFFIHIVGLLYTNDLKYAMHDIKIKLPLLFIPIAICTSHSISLKQLKQILLIFVATVIVGTFISFAVYLGFTKRVITDIREISIFISHIRFGLMVVFSIFILLYYLYTSYSKLSIIKRVIYLLGVFWLLLFLLILQSVTSWVVITICAYIVITVYYKQINQNFIKIISWFFIVVIPVLFIGLVSYTLFEFYNVDKVEFESLPTHTELGNKYKHNLDSDFTENGHYVWLYYSGKEMSEYWSKYSDIPYAGIDAKGQPIKYTLVRYLTSMNLTKDAKGLSQLTDEDVELIESGYASCAYKSKFTPYVKLYELIWELNQYVQYGNPNSKTISMRIEYAKAGLYILKDNLLFGVGTGDVQDSFDEHYEKTSSKLEIKNRRRAHNQYLTFALTFGVIGFALLLYAFARPVQINIANWTALSLIFITIIALSMLNEDTLETQSGATFFAYFYCLLILRKNNND